MMKTYEEIISIIDENQKNNLKFPYHIEKTKTIMPLLKSLFYVHRVTKGILKYEKKHGFSYDAKKKIVDIYEKFLSLDDTLSELKEHYNKLIGWYIEKVYSDANELYVGFSLSTNQEFNNDIKEFEKILNEKRSA